MPPRDDANSRLVLEPVARPSDQEIGSLAFSPAGNLLAWTAFHWVNGSTSGTSATPGRIRSRGWWLTIPCGTWRFVGMANSWRSVRRGGVPEVWNVVTRQRVYPSGPDDFRGARERGIGGVVALSPDDTWLAVEGAGGSITVWDMRRGELVLALPEEHSRNWDLAWSPDRQRLAAAFLRRQPGALEHPPRFAQLAQIGLDWQDAPLSPAASSEPAEAGSEARPLETARLFALELFGTAQATLAVEGNVCRVDIAAVDGTELACANHQAVRRSPGRCDLHGPVPRQGGYPAPDLPRWIYR